jgi:DNA-binding response OmpR family regulator
MKRIRVVAIDDVSDILDLIQYNLNKEGMDVEVFVDSAEALEHISKNPPDIVVSDWMMPEPNGLEICKRLQENDLTRHIPLIMLTCKGNITDYKDALAAGARDYVVKPVRMEELIRRIKLIIPEHFNRVKFG